MSSSLGPQTVLRRVAGAHAEASPDGRVSLHHPRGESLLGGVTLAEVEAVLAAVDGRATAEELCRRLAPGLPPPRSRALLRHLLGELLEEVPAAGAELVLRTLEPPPAPARVGIVGGGSAGYLTALALRMALPALAVTVIESPAVPVIGVGEATTPLMPQFLHQDLGLDVGELLSEVQPTLKLGLRFLWGQPDTGDFPYPFGPLDLAGTASHGGGDLWRASVQARLMRRGRVPLRPAAEVAPQWFGGPAVAYHLDNRRFVAYLERRAAAAGVERLPATIVEAELAPVGGALAGLRTSDGRRLVYDLYVDASGFRSLLLEGALASPWISYQTSLPTDRAVVAAVPGRPLAPYTTAETLDCGWCWSTPQPEADHRGYVFASGVLADDAAEAEMRRANPGMGEARLIRFRSGRHRHFWRGNVVAVGNAYGFVEPLESTALHLLIRQIGLLTRALTAGGPVDRDGLDARVGGWWDYLRFFLALHYRHNRRRDTPFWREARAAADLVPFGELAASFAARGLLSLRAERRFPYPDPLWGPEGIDCLLLGQGVASQPPANPPERSTWQAQQEAEAALTREAAPHAAALAALLADDEARASLAAGLAAAGPAFAWSRSTGPSLPAAIAATIAAP